MSIINLLICVSLALADAAFAGGAITFNQAAAPLGTAPVDVAQAPFEFGEIRAKGGPLNKAVGELACGDQP